MAGTPAVAPATLHVEARTTGCYGRMFPAASAPNEQYLAKLEALGRSMLAAGRNPSADCASSFSPCGYTYFAQLVDHDVSFDRLPLAQANAFSPEGIPNRRSPWLDLDHVYGGGPGVSPQLYEGSEGAERFRLADNSDLPSGDRYKLLGDQSLPLHERDFRDLENAMVLQLRVLFMRLHNVAIDHRLSCGLAEYDADDCTPFRKAARLVRWTYQRLVRRDLLPRVLDKTVLARVQGDGPAFQWPDGAFFIPIEFAAAAFRFGHSIVRGSYQMNRRSRVLLRDLISPSLATDAIPERLLIEWDNFFTTSNHRPAPMEAIDTRITPDLGDLTAYTARITGPKELPVRTLQRGAWMRLPSGQQVARALGLPVLAAEQLTGAASSCDGMRDSSGEVLADAGLTEETPLFYYILREAELAPNCGAHLGAVGSRIVAETLEGAFRFDADSYWPVEGGWSPLAWPVGNGRARKIETFADLIAVVCG